MANFWSVPRGTNSRRTHGTPGTREFLGIPKGVVGIPKGGRLSLLEGLQNGYTAYTFCTRVGIPTVTVGSIILMLASISITKSNTNAMKVTTGIIRAFATRVALLVLLLLALGTSTTKLYWYTGVTRPPTGVTVRPTSSVSVSGSKVLCTHMHTQMGPDGNIWCDSRQCQCHCPASDQSQCPVARLGGSSLMSVCH
eukprot:3179686-Rhodomonas_salina.1